MPAFRTARRIGSDKKIRDLAKVIKQTHGTLHSIVEIGPSKYNALYHKIGNLNKLLAWGHARVIENLAGQRPDCPRALSDQFANPRMIERSLMQHGRKIKLEQRTKAESDFAVAAASILARERFIDWLDKTGREYQVVLPRGASEQVKKSRASWCPPIPPMRSTSLQKRISRPPQRLRPSGLQRRRANSPTQNRACHNEVIWATI